MKRIVLGLSFALVLMTAPLVYRLLAQMREGQSKTESLTLSESTWNMLHDRLHDEEGVDFITGVRRNAERDEDVVLLISASRVVPAKLILEMDQIIDEAMGADVRVKMAVLQEAVVRELPEGDEEDLPVVNE